MKKVKMLETIETSTFNDPEDCNGVRTGEEGYKPKCWYKLRKNNEYTIPNQLTERLKKLGHVEIIK